jgi:membrane protease YdiL (CAAX protease family)
LGLTAILGFIAIGINQMFGGTLPNFGDVSGVQIVAGLAFQIFFFTLTEEPAWRGFALPRLQAKYSAFVSSLILGALWGGWHIPLFLIPGSFQATLPFAGFMLSAIATAFLFTWLFNHTNGSVLLAGILHAATDLTIAQMGVMQNGAQLFWIFVAVQWLAALGVIVWQGATNLAHERVALNWHAATK